MIMNLNNNHNVQIYFSLTISITLNIGVKNYTTNNCKELVLYNYLLFLYYSVLPDNTSSYISDMNILNLINCFQIIHP